MSDQKQRREHNKPTAYDWHTADQACRIADKAEPLIRAFVDSKYAATTTAQCQIKRAAHE